MVIRTVENIISSGTNCGIQILVEYKDVGVSNQQDKKNAKIDWRASLATEEQRAIFDRLKEMHKKSVTEIVKLDRTIFL